MKRVYATTDPTEAELLRALLRDAGIDSALDNQGGASYAVGLPVSVSPLGIDVADEDGVEAAEILARHFEHRAPDGDPDPEAPEPLSPEENSAFEEKVRRGNRRWGRRLLYVYFLPGLVYVVVLILQGELKGAVIVSGVLAGCLAVVWVINLLAESQVKEKGPAS